MNYNILDRNGCSILNDVWCYNCLPDYGKMKINKGKGRMVYIGEVEGINIKIDRLKYECIKCGYNYTYWDSYVNDYAIR